MLKTIFKRVTWLARGTSMVLGLAVMLALVFGLTATALAEMPGDPFKLGRGNTIDRLTKLVGSVAGPMLRIDNNNADTNATALDLQVEPGNAPMRVGTTPLARLPTSTPIRWTARMPRLSNRCWPM